MTPNSLRVLADCLERDFMTTEDRHRWVSDLRGFAKGIERSVMLDESWFPADKSHKSMRTKGLSSDVPKS